MKAQTCHKLILADDHIVLRDLLANFLDTEEDLDVIGRADNGQELIKLIENGSIPDLVILDVNMPLLDGYDAAKWLRTRFPDIRILILTMYDSEIALIRLLQEGARGFLKKDIHPTEVKRAICSVMENGYYYSYNTNAKLSNVFFRTFETNNKVEKNRLSHTEIEFLKLAATDKTYKEIASCLHLSPRTIDHYRESLFMKLDVKSRVGLAIFALKAGIVSFD